MSASRAPRTPTATRSEFAAMHGWAPSYVTKLVARGRLVMTADGKRIKVDESNRRLKETERVDRQGVREHHARARRGKLADSRAATDAPSAESGTAEDAAERGGKPGPDAATSLDDYNRARAQKEAAAAAMAEIELRRLQGELVEIAQVRDTAARIAGIVARGFERIGPRIGPVWSVEQDPAKREQLLEDELRKVQLEFADEVAKLTGGGGA